MGLNLTYSTYSVTLPSPELGDIVRFSSGAINRKLKGGLPKIFKDPLWPVIEIRQYSIRNCTLVQKTDFENLYRAAVGLSVTLQESYGVLLTGFIMNPTVEILTIDDKLCGSYDIEFEYLATIVSYQVGNCLTDPLYVAVTPVLGASNFHSTLENDTFYQLFNESATERLQDESNGYLMLESF